MKRLATCRIPNVHGRMKDPGGVRLLLSEAPLELRGGNVTLYRVTSQTKKHAPQDPTVGLCLEPCGGLRRVKFSYDRGTPVWIPMSVFKRHSPDIEQWSRAVAPKSSRGGLILA